MFRLSEVKNLKINSRFRLYDFSSDLSLTRNKNQQTTKIPMELPNKTIKQRERKKESVNRQIEEKYDTTMQTNKD